MTHDRGDALLASFFVLVTVTLVVVLAWDISTPNGLVAVTLRGP